MVSLQLGASEIHRDGDNVYFVAEIGQNHQGDLEIAKRMIVEAWKAGCHCVKFQKSCLKAKFAESALRRKYDGINSWGKTYGEHKAYLEFSIDQYLELQAFCRIIGIDFTASAMDEVSLYQLDSMNVPFIKIGSGDANNFPLLEKAAMLKRPLVISTGMQTAKTITRIVQIMENARKHNYAILHCVSSYPTEPQNCQLRRISWLRQKYSHLVIGYSGHEIGLEISKAAFLLGARIIERHFTLDNNLKGSDHRCSLDPTNMAKLVVSIKQLINISNISKSLNTSEIITLLDESAEVIEALDNCDDERCIASCEMSCRQKLGKSLVAAKALSAVHTITADDLCVKVSEPSGIWAEFIDYVIGSKLYQCVETDKPIMWQHINKPNLN